MAKAHEIRGSRERGERDGGINDNDGPTGLAHWPVGASVEVLDAANDH